MSCTKGFIGSDEVTGKRISPILGSNAGRLCQWLPKRWVNALDASNLALQQLLLNFTRLTQVSYEARLVLTEVGQNWMFTCGSVDCFL